MLGATAKDLRRLRHIARVVARHGYGELVGRISAPLHEEVEAQRKNGSAPPLEILDRETGPRKFRKMLEELGPTFIKLGQVLSSRPDLVSAPYVDELKHLQDECTPLSFDEIKGAIQASLGRDPDELFERIDPAPLATASVAQVHRAVTKGGAQVVVKVQRPGIRDAIAADVDILYRIAQLLEAVIEESAIADPVAVVREFESAMHAELNFELEAANIREFARTHQGRNDIVVPAVHPELSSSAVLTMDFLDGTPLSRLPPEVDRRRIALRICQEAFDEVFVDGFFHADPHPGNLFVLSDGRYGILDFGLCGRLTPQMRETLVVLGLAVALKDADTAARTLYRLGQPDHRVNISELRDDLESLFARYLDRRLEDVHAKLVLQELMSLAIRHKIRVPAEYTMLSRAGATIEGIVRDFDPELDIAKVAAPYAERLLMGRIGPQDLQGGLYKAALQLQGLSHDVPMQLSQLLADLSAGNFAVNVKGQSLDRLGTAILVSATALSMSILGGSLVLGSFLALTYQGVSIAGVPLLAIFASLGGLAIFFWVSAYVIVRPKLRKIRLSDLVGRRVATRSAPAASPGSSPRRESNPPL